MHRLLFEGNAPAAHWPITYLLQRRERLQAWRGTNEIAQRTVMARVSGSFDHLEPAEGLT
jgi:hypothetical protein